MKKWYKEVEHDDFTFRATIVPHNVKLGFYSIRLEVSTDAELQSKLLLENIPPAFDMLCVGIDESIKAAEKHYKETLRSIVHSGITTAIKNARKAQGPVKSVTVLKTSNPKSTDPAPTANEIKT